MGTEKLQRDGYSPRSQRPWQITDPLVLHFLNANKALQSKQITCFLLSSFGLELFVMLFICSLELFGAFTECMVMRSFKFLYLVFQKNLIVMQKTYFETITVTSNEES